MTSIKLRTTALIPSGFRMPASGHAFITSARFAGGCPAIAAADVRVVPTSIQGTSVWSPPTC